MGNLKNQTNRRILIIDDNENIHRDFYAILSGQAESLIDLDQEKKAIFGESDLSSSCLRRQENFEVDSAFQGEEGLEKIRQAVQEDRPYAMAFVDIRMPPGWDGLETIRRIWQEYPELQVVICTAYSDYSWRQIVEELKETEKLLILKKPFDCVEVYQIASALTEKWCLARQARYKREKLRHIMEGRIKVLRKTNEELMIALKEAEDAERAKSMFLANMSHEIRTPMNSVIGFAEILCEEDLSREQQEFVAHIYQSSKNLLLIINDILDISKIEAGKLEVETVECNLDQLLDEINSLFRITALKKGLEFKIEQRDNLPGAIYTDSKRLRQCLVNLIGNAIKFTDKGHVYLTVSHEENAENSPFLRFDIEDTGIGILPEKQGKVFESFKQAEDETSRKYGGTGLGLTITKQLAELLGGTISLNSQPEKGSVFTLWIPATIDCCDQSAKTDVLVT